MICVVHVVFWKPDTSPHAKDSIDHIFDYFRGKGGPIAGPPSHLPIPDGKHLLDFDIHGPLI
jgi:hypothetical protein